MADRNRRREEKAEHYFDYSLVFLVLFLLGFGLVMIYSTSSYKANLDSGDPTYYLKKQLMASVLGLVAMFVVSHIPYQIWQRFAMLGYMASIFRCRAKWCQAVDLHRTAQPAACRGGEALYDSGVGDTGK